MIVGLICAFEEEGRIGAAVESLFAAGCGRVVVVDGAWTGPDGRLFGGGEFFSADRTLEEAREAGAQLVNPNGAVAWTDGGKRDWAIGNCGAEPGDHLLLLDADETVHAAVRLDPLTLPSAHGCVLHRDLHANDLPGLGGEWPRGDYGTAKPLLRWLRWSVSLGCDKPGRYRVSGEPIDAYLVQAMSRVADRWNVPALGQAYRVLRDREHELAPAEASLLPILEGVEIVHDSQPAEARVEAKRRYYQPEVAACL